MTSQINTYPTVGLSSSIRPQNDFFGYVNSKWLAQHPIPESEVDWGSFSILAHEAKEAMHTIYEDLQTKKPSIGSVEQQARDFYFTGMHRDELEATHLKDLRALCARVDAINSLENLSAVIGWLHSHSIGVPWMTYVDVDEKDSSSHIFQLRQSGLTLPNRDYYLDDSASMKNIRTEYEAFTRRVQQAFPDIFSNASELWQPVMELETAIAKVSRTPAELRDLVAGYNKMTYASLKKAYPHIDWKQYEQAHGWKADDKINVGQPEFMAFINKRFTVEALPTWKLYLKWHIVTHFLGMVSNAYSELAFSFFGKVLAGTTEMRPLWKRTIQAVESDIGDATGRLYAQKYFPESSKQQVLELVEQVRGAYAERIEALDWMKPETKAYAKKKLAAIKVLIGYPDTWRDFSTLQIGRQSFITNSLAADAHEVAYWLGRLHEPTTRDDWFMTPQTVNAYHDPNRLVICFPAAILQKPFFDPEAPLAVNMGGIGTVIGHELTHGFDDQGCQYDAEGNMRTWQSSDEQAAFHKKAQRIVTQADHYEVLPGHRLRGSLVLGESIADLGGIEIALHALKTASADKQLSSEELAIFFTNYAITECHHTREEKLREQLLSDPHPVPEFRVNSTLANVDAFYQAFSIKESDALYLKEGSRARIW